MSINVVVPPLGESVSEATIAKWHKKPGDAVKIDELLVELETDKVTLEVNSPANGKVEEVLVSEGSSVSVGAILGKIAEGAVAATPSVASAPASQPVVTTISQPVNASIITSPAAGKIAQDKGVNLASIQGSGKDNRITKGDVLNASVAPVATAASNVVREERVKMTKLRKTIADRLKYSQNTAAILTTFNEVDMSEVFRIRKQYQEQFMEKHGVKLGFMSIFAKAVVKALGIAVGTDQGLVVPVVRNVDQMSFSDIEKGIAALGKKARDGKLTMADMSGATFSITNGGTYGSLLSTPIINPPQSGILGMHNIVERPIAVNGQVVIRPMMYIALSYDHRIVDGKEAVTFLVKIKQMVENPEKLLFDL